MSLRIVFMGTPLFAVPTLEKLIQNNFQVVAVVTMPDKPAGRKLKVQFSEVKKFAMAHQLPLLQPEKLKSPEFLNQLEALKPDLGIVVAFRMLPEVVWKMPRYGTFNLHASLLPDYRGAAPINWAIINGEKETGLTTFFLKHEIDTGEIILQTTEKIFPEDNVGSLHDRLMYKGADLVLQTVRLIERGNYTSFPQKDIISKPAPKLSKENTELDFSKTAIQLHNFVRGLSPYPAAWTKINGKICKIFQTSVISENSTIIEKTYQTDGKTYLHFATGEGTLAVEQIQMEGRKAMPIQDFLRGNPFK